MSNRSLTAVSSAAFLSMLVAAVTACGSSGSATGSTCPTGSTLTYETFGKSFVQTNCLGCHATGGTETPTLDTLDAVRRESAEIDKQAAAGPNAVNTSMPDTGSVAESERRKLGEWLACGAP